MWKKNPGANKNIEVLVRSYDDRGDPNPPNNWRVEVQVGTSRMVVLGKGGFNMQEHEALALGEEVVASFDVPIPLVMHCPECGERHIDEGALATEPHRTHACQECGFLWAPSHLATVGVRFLPGCKNDV